MKPFIAFCVILIFFQTLIFGSLVKIEFPDSSRDQWGETCIQNKIVLDPFILPAKEGFDQNFQNKNGWIPFQYNNAFLISNTNAVSKDKVILFIPCKRYKYSAIPVFLIYGALRI